MMMDRVVVVREGYMIRLRMRALTLSRGPSGRYRDVNMKEAPYFGARGFIQLRKARQDEHTRKTYKARHQNDEAH